jgi:hypothetical protein
VLAAVVLPTAAEADALSTALLAAGAKGLGGLKVSHPEVRALVAAGTARNLQVFREGL